MGNRREKREARRDAARAATKHRLETKNAGFESTTVELPKNVTRFTLKDDKTKHIDVLAYTAGKNNPYCDEGIDYWERTYHVHTNIGPDNKAYVCPQMESGGEWNWPGYATGGKKRCAVCEEIIKMMNDREENKAMIDAIKLRDRQLFNVRDLDEDSKEVQVWDVSNFLFGALLDTELQDDEEEGGEHQDFYDWEDGFSLRLNVEERSFNPKGKEGGKSQKFYAVKTIKFKPRKEQYDPEDIAEKVHCLDDFIKVLEPDELKRIFLQVQDDSEDENTTQQFKGSDVKKIKLMTEKELKKFIYANDLEIDPDDFDTLSELRDAVLEVVKEAIAEDGGKEKKKVDKKADKKATKKKAKDEDEDEDEESDSEDEDEDAKSEDEDEDNEESEDEDEDSEESEDDDNDEDSEESEDEDIEDEDEKPAKRGRGRPAGSGKKK